MSRSAASTTAEILISDVEIIRMLTPESASAPKKSALTPGCERIPAPISEILPILSSNTSESKPTSSCTPCSAASATWPSCLGSVNEMSACPVDLEVLCTIMSMLMPDRATTRKILAATPTLSGMPDTVTVASLLSCATPVMIGWSISFPSARAASASLTQVPSLLLNDDRTWIAI